MSRDLCSLTACPRSLNIRCPRIGVYYELGSHRGFIVKPQQLEKWKATREKGMLRYVLVTGVLSYGLAMFIAMTFFAHRDDLSPKFIAVSAVLWTLGGAVFGTAMWFVFEYQFRKAVGSSD